MKQRDLTVPMYRELKLRTFGWLLAWLFYLFCIVSSVAAEPTNSPGADNQSSGLDAHGEVPTPTSVTEDHLSVKSSVDETASPMDGDQSSRQGIVVWDLRTNEGVGAKDAALITSFVAGRAAEISEGRVISEADIRTLLKGEEARQSCGSEAASCIAEIGAALGAVESISGDIGMVGSYWILNLIRINTRTAEVVGRSSHRASGDIDQLVEILPNAVAELFGKKISSEQADSTLLVRKGMLSIKTDPSQAKVSVNQKQVGLTPFSQMLAPGEYTISLQFQGYNTVERKVTLRANGWEQIEVEMEIAPGVLVATTEPPEAEMIINQEESVGRTPLRIERPQGKYQLEFILEEFLPTQREVALYPGKETAISVKLNRDYPMNPYKKGGYATFFIGLGLSAVGAVATWQAWDKSRYAESTSNAADVRASRQASQDWMKGAYASYSTGGALMITGLILWVLSPGDEHWWEENKNLIEKK